MSQSPVLCFCRDCLALEPVPSRRCTHCGSPRLLAHPELASLSIAHIDCDAFYAAVEKRDRPDLADKPLIIGGGRRGVVLTACYNARIHGVRSAMPMFQALKLCPHATIIRPDMAKYAEVGRTVRERMRTLTPLVEPLSIDEAFLDLSGTERLHKNPPAHTLALFAREVEADLGITVSVGLSHNKFLAKIASDLQKPRGFSVIGRAETTSFLAPRPISTIWGVGASMSATLARDGLIRIEQLQRLEEADLMKRYGVMGQRLYRLSRGLDNRPVRPRAEMKSISAETTFEHDRSTPAELMPVLRELCEKVAGRVKATEFAARTVVLKLKGADFRTRTRNRRLAAPTRLADRIFEAARLLLEREMDGTRFRLLGVGCSDFTAASAADPLDLVDPAAARRAKAERALDSLRARFGLGSIETGHTFRTAAEREAEAARKAARPREISPKGPASG